MARRAVCEGGYDTLADAERDARTLRNRGYTVTIKKSRARSVRGAEFKVCWKRGGGLGRARRSKRSLAAIKRRGKRAF